MLKNLLRISGSNTLQSWAGNRKLYNNIIGLLLTDSNAYSYLLVFYF